VAPDLAVPLRAGPLRLVFDRGELRWIRLGEREVVRGIYFALRAEGWATIPYEIRNLEIAAEPASFRVRFQAHHERGPVRFDWRAEIAGGPDGRIGFAVHGKAGASFLRNRIGLCVLHPAQACAGRPCIVQTVDGDRAESVFPALVAPHQPFRNVRAILHEVSPGVEVEVRLEGETFETEDHRNWGDDSYKTYGTPLHLPHPVTVKSGATVDQSVTLSLFGITTEPVEQAAASVPGAVPRKRNSPEPVVVDLAGGELPLPALGLAGAELVALAEAEAARLRPLRLAHVRADLHLEGAAWEAALERAVGNARLLDVPLELALFLPDDPHAVLQQLAERASSWQPRVASWLVYRADDRTTADGLAATAREALAKLDRGAGFGGGSDAHFAELNRRRPLPRSLDKLVFALNPQVHAGDNATLVENLGSLRRIADTLRSFAERTPLGVSPVTLRPRTDPSPTAWRKRNERPFTDDPRQDTSFTAAWTLGFLAAAAEAGFASLTFFELVGPRGVLEAAGRAFPVLDAFADVAALSEAGVVRARLRRPERVQALALRSPGGRVRLFLANVTAEAHPVRVEGLAGRVSRASLGLAQPGEESGLEIELRPHEIVRLDAEG
jgi:hypothetical protein